MTGVASWICDTEVSQVFAKLGGKGNKKPNGLMGLFSRFLMDFAIGFWCFGLGFGEFMIEFFFPFWIGLKMKDILKFHFFFFFPTKQHKIN